MEQRYKVQRNPATGYRGCQKLPQCVRMKPATKWFFVYSGPKLLPLRARISAGITRKSKYIPGY